MMTSTQATAREAADAPDHLRVIDDDCPFSRIAAEVRRESRGGRWRRCGSVTRHSGTMQIAVVNTAHGTVVRFVGEPLDAADPSDRAFVAGAVRRVRELDVEWRDRRAVDVRVVHWPRGWGLVS